MLNKLKKSNSEGFTIIEVMIVLAIAGLILLIVFLAVPALQRNARNTAIKNDAGAVSAGVSEFKSNNDGSPPTTITATTVSGAAGTTQAAIKLQGGTTVSSTATPAVGAIGYQVGSACPGSASSARAVAIYYQVETSGAASYKCVDS
jgi:prepilin-type N-terminal cleavage/methylation domain-containing protein